MSDPTAAVRAVDLAALVAGKLCHDFISPAGAISSGLDLLNDPSAQDMRDDALALISQSAGRMVALVHFARVAFGASTTAERFTGETLKGLVDGLLSGGRAQIAWALGVGEFGKPQGRALLNLAYMTVGALPSGGLATISARQDERGLILQGVAEGARARLKPEALTGLSGHTLVEGLQGQWIQPYWLWLTMTEAGGQLTVDATEGRVVLTALMPA